MKKIKLGKNKIQYHKNKSLQGRGGLSGSSISIEYFESYSITYSKAYSTALFELLRVVSKVIR